MVSFILTFCCLVCDISTQPVVGTKQTCQIGLQLPGANISFVGVSLICIFICNCTVNAASFPVGFNGFLVSDSAVRSDPTGRAEQICQNFHKRHYFDSTISSGVQRSGIQNRSPLQLRRLSRSFNLRLRIFYYMPHFKGCIHLVLTV